MPVSNRLSLLPLVILFAIGLPACASNPVDTEGYVIQSQTVLSNELAETSGLVCRDDGMMTINDSGNAPVLFSLQKSGEYSGITLDLVNQDWEAITADGDHIYVADVGNNNGKRKDLRILAINKQNQAKTLSIEYQGNQPDSNVAYAHDVDAEALTHKDGALILFSKSWKTGIANVFSVDKASTKQTLAPIATVNNLPGMITGADWDNNANQYVVVGYSTSGMGLMAPFIATLDERFGVTRVEKLVGFNQVEGVCVQNESIWFTQEQGPFAQAKLVNIRLR